MRFCVHHTRGGCHRVFLFHNARQAVMEIIGQIEHKLRLVHSTRLLVVQQLINGIKGRELNPRSFVQFFKGNYAMYLGNRFVRTPIAITIHAADCLAVLAYQRVIHAPSIDAYGNRRFAKFFGFFQAVQNFGKQTLVVPNKVFLPVVCNLLFGSVLETVDFLRHHFSVFEMRYNMSTRRRTDINRKIIIHKFSLLWHSFLCCHYYNIYFIFCLYMFERLTKKFFYAIIRT